MLVITRREGEEVVLTLPSGEEIKLVVVSLNNRHTRIGFEAPRTVGIQRYDEEQRMAKELLALKKMKKINCDDNAFVGFWLDTEIPQFGVSARQALRKEPSRYFEIIEVLRKELNANPKL
jgi:sRNA-binding carbon storage regulator CsrA